jgi:toxin HigB-1
MIVSFKDRGSEDIFDGNDSKEARKQCPMNCWEVARRKLDQINALKGDRKGQHSIRVNEQYRICFIWILEGASEVEIVDYH